MTIEIIERKKLATQRRTRRLRQQRLLHTNGYHANGHSDNGNSVADKPKGHPIEELGWTREDALAAYYTFKPFEEDWNAPGMELYDDL